jgi:hypothetical protein
MGSAPAVERQDGRLMFDMRIEQKWTDLPVALVFIGVPPWRKT